MSEVAALIQGKSFAVEENLDNMVADEVLFGQFCKELIRKMDKLEQFDLPDEALRIVEEVKEDSTRMYGGIRG